MHLGTPKKRMMMCGLGTFTIHVKKKRNMRYIILAILKVFIIEVSLGISGVPFFHYCYACPVSN